MKIVSCLSTFAALAVESSISTRSLEASVAARTAELQEALLVKQKVCTPPVDCPLILC